MWIFSNFQFCNTCRDGMAKTGRNSAGMGKVGWKGLASSRSSQFLPILNEIFESNHLGHELEFTWMSENGVHHGITW